MSKRLITFTDECWSDYVSWQAQDKKTLKRINSLIKAIQRDPFEGEGKPEPLRHNLSGFWSRRINSRDRLVYEVTESSINVVSCKEHY